MKPRSLGTRVALATFLVFAPLSASAASCAGFTDVDDTSAFCANVEWVRNRSITLGCTSNTLYCPDAPVDRLTMAAFMHRLGAALTPIDLPTAVGNLWDADLVTPRVMCSTANFQVASFPRRAFLRAQAGVSGPWDNIVVAAELVYSTNDGATWTAVPDSAVLLAVYGEPLWDAKTAVPFGVLDLAVGTTYRFALRLSDPVATGALVTLDCAVAVQLYSRNSASSPL